MNSNGLNFSEFLEFAEAYKVQRNNEEKKLGFADDLDDDRLEEFFDICKGISEDEEQSDTVSKVDLEAAFIFCGDIFKQRKEWLKMS